jgi:hypothetical protein
MGGQNRQGDWDDFERARQPLGPDGVARQRARKLQRPGGSRRGYPQDYSDLAVRGGSRQPGSGVPGGRGGQGNGGRSRFVAAWVLAVAAVVVIVAGVAASSGDGAGGASVPVSLLPFPQDTVTSATQ